MRFRLALGLAVVLAACSGGGSSGPTVPSLPWGNFRHDDTNSGIGGIINRNKGNVTLLESLESSTDESGTIATLSTPTIDKNNNLILATKQGVISVGPDGSMRWTFEGFEPASPNGTAGACAACMNPGTGTCVPVGSVTASPTVEPGNEVVFGNDGTDGAATYVFAIRERNPLPDCLWAAPVPAGTRSSALAQIYNFDLSLQTVYTAGDDGVLRVLNSDGSTRWSVATGDGPITSTPALDALSNVYVTTPTGALLAYDPSGQPLTTGFPFPTGPPPPEPYQPSPGAGTNLFAIGTGGALLQGKPQGWQFRGEGNPFVGSPAFLAQGISFMNTTAMDTIVYVVDTSGTAYGVRNQTGEIEPIQVCSQDVNVDCRTDSCNPLGTGTDVCLASSHRCAMTGQSCTQDTCVVNNHGNCIVTEGQLPFATQPGQTVSITASPIVSGDPFVVVGTTDGRICARNLANIVPGQSMTPPLANWRGGYCSVTTPSAETCAIDADCPEGQTCATPSSCSSTGGGCTFPGGHCKASPAQTCTPNGGCASGDICIAAGPHCSVTTTQSCGTDNNCPMDEYCVYLGCIPLTLPDGELDGGPVLSTPIIGENAVIYATTAKGFYAIK